MKSYGSRRLGVVQRMAELALLYKLRKGTQRDEVRELVVGLTDNKARIERLLGEKMTGKDVLEIGPGQFLKQARFYGIENRVTAIDLDQVELTSVGAWFRLWSSNGTLRLIKTLGRKLAGIDRQFFREYYRALPDAKGARVNFVRKDATDTGFADASFHVTLSLSVLEHIPEPARVVREMARVTRPGGAFFHVVHIYTSDSGAHDPRSFARVTGDFPRWCHLRPSVAHLSAPNCYVNKLSLREWIRAFETELPGCTIERIPELADSQRCEEISEIRKKGELAELSDDELLTDCLVVTWIKRPIAA